ncbi:DNA topoisomerase 2-binding protein 1-like [Argonauta hians]
MSGAELKVKCLQNKDGEVSIHCTEAFNALKAHGFKPAWINEEECFAVTQKDKNIMYLCDKFEGEAFEHLKSHGLRILGPICVLTCLEQKVTIPRTKVPILNLAMKDTIISCTNIDKVLRESLHEKILMMGGEIQRNFTEIVTHLVAGMVGSSKYQVASNLKKHIMLPDWVNAVWETSQEGHRSVHCNDEKFQKYTCPLFKGLIITVSGLESSERKKVKQLVEMEGGVYSGEMKVDECTHLILNEPKGQKYSFALRFNIQIVKSSWLYDSIEAGYCLVETNYQLKPDDPNSFSEMKTSTPTKDNCEPKERYLPNVSMINQLSETAVSVADTTMSQADKHSRNFESDISSLAISAPCFDGCKIYLSGFRGTDQERLLRIINVGGGTRFNSLNDHVTHVVAGEMVPADMEYLRKAAHRPHIVNPSWLLDCARENKCVPEKCHYVQNLPFADETSMEPPKAPGPLPKRKADVSKVNSTKTSTVEFGDNTDEELALMSQYLQGPSMTEIQGNKETRKSDFSTSTMLSATTTTTKQSGVDSAQVFSGKTFICCGLGTETTVVEGTLTEHGGEILRNSRQIPDYALVPLGGCGIKFTANEVVTRVWMEMCLEKSCLFPVSDNVLFQPIEINHQTQPLLNCVIAFSGMCGAEKNCLISLGKLLGATIQLVFVKKPTKGMLSNTHLVVQEAEGAKYEAAIKWKVHAVKKDWLIACAASGKLEPEHQYLCRPASDVTTTMTDVTMTTTDATMPTTDEGRNETCLTENASNRSSMVSKQTSLADQQMSDSTIRDGGGRSLVASQKDDQLNPPCDDITMKAYNNSMDSSQKENRLSTSYKQIPVTLQTSRILELQEQESHSSPKHLNIQQKLSTETPSKFLGQGKEYHPTYELNDLTSILESQMKGLSTSRSRRSSIPWGELFSKHIEEAVKISADPQTMPQNSQDVEATEKNEGPLKGVVISVARKLSGKQSVYNDIALSLGADYTWTYDDSCTHFIFQGKQNDTNREFRCARDQQKTIVSPYWLMMCKEQNGYVDESLFPHTFNPNLNLQSIMNNSGKETPRRSRRSLRPDASTYTPIAKKTPKVSKQRIDEEEEEEKEEAEEGGDMETDSTLPCIDGGEDGGAAGGGEEGMEVEENRKPEVDNAVEMAEIQEALNKELENIKASGSKRSKKRNKRLNSSCNDSHNTPYTSKVVTTGKTTDHTSKMSSSESSQSVQVTWYDPTERLEMQKVAAQLERAYCPTQDPLDGFPATKQDSGVSGAATVTGNAELNDSGKKISSRTSTPEQPSIVLPLSKKLDTVASPQPIDLLSDDDTLDCAAAAATSSVERPSFLLSSISASERVDYGALIEELGGNLLESQNYQTSSTHLVVGCPARNEKYLACMAAGKWILHKSYFEDCRRTKKFVQEDKHEWGSVSTESVLASANTVTKSLAYSAQRWRLKIQELKKQNSRCEGAFYEWSVILCTDKKREGNFERLLKAGGARVVSAKPPFSNPITATHAFIDALRKDITNNDLEILLKNNVLCFRPEYIAAYLLNDVLQSPDEYCPSEVIGLRARLNLPNPSMRKRKGVLTSEEAKRSRSSES